jgi:hypothetical protein
MIIARAAVRLPLSDLPSTMEVGTLKLYFSKVRRHAHILRSDVFPRVRLGLPSYTSPPETRIHCPVIQPASSEQKSTAAAMRKSMRLQRKVRRYMIHICYYFPAQTKLVPIANCLPTTWLKPRSRKNLEMGAASDCT